MLAIRLIWTMTLSFKFEACKNCTAQYAGAQRLSAPFQNPDFLSGTNRLTLDTVLQVHTYVVFTQQLHIEESRTIFPFAF